jgi:hypothetical protein
MGTNALDPEMGALVHKEKARQQTMHRNNPNKQPLANLINFMSMHEKKGLYLIRIQHSRWIM